MEYLKIILRIIFFYFYIILIYRLMGKREVGQLGIIDLIVSILIADLVSAPIIDSTKSIVPSVMSVLSLVLLQIALSYTSLKSNTIRNLLDGNPTIIIKNGKINYQEMIKQKYNLDDLLTQLREKGERSIEDIEHAILENNGSLSVFKYNKKKEKTPVPLPLILDGKIQKATLKQIDKNETFILNILKKQKLELSNIFYAFYKDKGIYIIKYKDLNKK